MLKFRTHTFSSASFYEFIYSNNTNNEIIVTYKTWLKLNSIRVFTSTFTYIIRIHRKHQPLCIRGSKHCQQLFTQMIKYSRVTFRATDFMWVVGFFPIFHKLISIIVLSLFVSFSSCNIHFLFPCSCRILAGLVNTHQQATTHNHTIVITVFIK